MKRIISLVLIAVLTFSVRIDTSAISVSSECACVIDMLTGRVIYDKNMQKRHTMASTTKIMTALIALENSNLDDVVTVSEKAQGEEGTSLYLKKGEKITMEDLLYGLMLQSGNDAAVAIAEAVSENVDDFASLMTERAKSLGANDTSFKNPNGLDEDGHYTTAYDLALITKEAMTNKKFAEIVKTSSKTIKDGTQTVTNHNKMLRIYDGCIGVKTGFTKKSGRCLVTAAERDNVKLIAVTLNAPDDWNDHARMLDFAFSRTEYFPVVLSGMTINTVTVKSGVSNTVELSCSEDFYITEAKEDKFKNIKVTCDIPKEVTAPVMAGEKLGELTIFYKGKEQRKIDLLASVNVDFLEKKHIYFWENFKKLITYSCQD